MEEGLIINQAIAPEAIDRTLSTDFPEIVSKFKIPSWGTTKRNESIYLSFITEHNEKYKNFRPLTL